MLIPHEWTRRPVDTCRSGEPVSAPALRACYCGRCAQALLVCCPCPWLLTTHSWTRSRSRARWPVSSSVGSKCVPAPIAPRAHARVYGLPRNHAAAGRSGSSRALVDGDATLSKGPRPSGEHLARSRGREGAKSWLPARPGPARAVGCMPFLSQAGEEDGTGQERGWPGGAGWEGKEGREGGTGQERIDSALPAHAGGAASLFFFLPSHAFP